MELNYSYGTGAYTNWIVEEPKFDRASAGNIESLFCLGNGYMGVRAATEEAYLFETRGFYVAGLFDAFHSGELNLEVSELANAPDWLAVDIELAGELFSLAEGRIVSYSRRLNIRDGELVRELEWESPSGKRSRICFHRFVSMASLHLSGLRISVVPLNYSGTLRIRSGINGQVTNSGTQHFRAGGYRVFDDGTMYQSASTQESGHTLVIAAKHLFRDNGVAVEGRELYESPRRQLFLTSEHRIIEEREFVFEKLVSVWTSRDFKPESEGDADVVGEELVVDRCISELRKNVINGYESCVEAHRERWNSLWKQIAVEIEGNDFDQLAVRFAQFHLVQMAPRHDDRLSIAAKGLSGEGYLGHAFWDTEIFIVPFFMFSMPDAARNLLMYRYRTLDGARENAKRSGNPGARYAWESAATGIEVTPGNVSIDIVTGLPIPVLTGELQLHITCDVAYSILRYVDATGDDAFLYDYGSEIVFEVARYWAGRVEFNANADSYEINHVIGPDEYGENVNNNSYTNYMVKYVLDGAVELARDLQKVRQVSTDRIANAAVATVDEVRDWTEKSAKIAVGIDEATNVIPQDDAFMQKNDIDITPYVGRTGSIIREIGWDAVRKSKVLKQADVIMLLYLLGDSFSEEVKRANWNYYEPKTLHDSSLSPSIHAIVASDMEDRKGAYDYFSRSIRIDIAESTGAGSKAGLHSASLGGIWQAVVNGFGGLRIENKQLDISPHLPDAWTRLAFPFYFRGNRYHVSIDRQGAVVRSDKGAETLLFTANGASYKLDSGSEVAFQ